MSERLHKRAASSSDIWRTDFIELAARSREAVPTECSADGYMGLPWKQVFAGSNPAALTNFSHARVA
jgi:hypothetical protein